MRPTISLVLNSDPQVLIISKYTHISPEKGERMKKIRTLSVLILLAVTMIVPAVLGKEEITIELKQAQFQWRAWSQFDSWTLLYQNRVDDDEYKLTGKVLHMDWEYSPAVQNLEGEKSVFVYNKKTGYWILKEGTVKYRYLPYYGDYDVMNYFRGYLDFDEETPSTENLVHGIAYQWVYVYAPQDFVLPDPMLYPVWDPTMEAWLVGFSIYLWDNTGETQAYSLTTHPFPGLISPVPASNYDPIDW